MDDKEFEAISAGLRASIVRFPNCKVASCDCDEKGGEWKVDCMCPGHWQAMDAEFGAGGGQWSLADAAASAKAGKPTRAERGEEDACL